MNKINDKVKAGIIAGIAVVLIISGLFVYNSSLQNNTVIEASTCPDVSESYDGLVSFAAVGDNIAHDRINQYADKQKGSKKDNKYDYTSIYEPIKDVISSYDLAYVNQETIMGGKKYGYKGFPEFNTPDAMAKALVSTGFDVVNGGTNHSYDKGYGAIVHNNKVWKKYKDITYLGTYSSQKDHDTLRVVEKNGIKIAFLSYTFGTNQKTITKSYSINLFDKDKIKKDVKKAKKKADAVVVFAHWGTEGKAKISAEQKTYAKLFASLNVDLVVGSHTHVIQPMKWIKGKNGHKTLVAYSLGNFMSTQEEIDNHLGGMLSCNFIKRNGKVGIYNVTWTPITSFFSKDEKTYYVKLLKDYSDKELKNHWLKTVYKRDLLKYYRSKTKKVIGKSFRIDM